VLSDNEVQKVTAKQNLLLKHGGVTVAIWHRKPTTKLRYEALT